MAYTMGIAGADLEVLNPHLGRKKAKIIDAGRKWAPVGEEFRVGACCAASASRIKHVETAAVYR